MLKKLSGWRDDLLKLVVLGVPTLLIQGVYALIAKRFFEQPWQALWFVVPLAATGWIAWQILLRKRRELALRGSLLVFFVAYVTTFSIAAQSDLLEWRRDLVAGDDTAPRSWLLPTHYGDWRYRLARRGKRSGELLIVTVPPAANLAAGRLQILKLIALAGKFGARGIAFDFHLRPETSDFDERICGAVADASLPIVFGHHLVRSASGRWRPAPIPSGFETCLPEDARAHVMVLRDVDGMVRFVPLRLEGGDRFALSERVAALLAGPESEAMKLPHDGYLQPLPPAEGHPRLAYEELEALGDAEARVEFRGSFLLVGEDSDAEQFATPLGERLGVEIHADALHSLRQGAGFRRFPPWLTFGVILVFCYLETTLAASGAPAGKLLRVALLSSIALGVAAAVAAWERLWIDVVYGLVALWLLVPVLLVLRRLRRGAPRPVAAAIPPL